MSIVGILIALYLKTPFYKKSKVYKITHCESCGEIIDLSKVADIIYCTKCGTPKNLYDYDLILTKIKKCDACNEIKSTKDTYCKCGKELGESQKIINQDKFDKVRCFEDNCIAFGIGVTISCLILAIITNTIS